MTPATPARIARVLDLLDYLSTDGCSLRETTDGEHKVIADWSWRDHDRAERIAEHAGLEIDYADSYAGECDHCYKAIPQPSGYWYWDGPGYHWVSDCALICDNCLHDNPEWTEEVLDHLQARQQAGQDIGAALPDIYPELEGWTLERRTTYAEWSGRPAPDADTLILALSPADRRQDYYSDLGIWRRNTEESAE